MVLAPRQLKAAIKATITVTLLAGALLASRDAAAQVCTVDTMCPGTACGGQVCNWNTGQVCNAAGTDQKGMDGWCDTTADCKCRDLGAVCVGVYCSFTLPSQAPGADAGGTGTGGAGGTSGADAGTPSSSGGGGCSIGGAGPAWTSTTASMAGLAGALAALLITARRRRRGPCTWS